MASSDLSVLIIGAGVGGLCLAQGLVKNGVKCSVFERDKSADFRPQGYRLRISPEGSRSLKFCFPEKTLELLLKTSGFSSGGHGSAFTYDYRELFSFEFPPTDSENFSVNRLTFRKVLLSGIEDIVHFDKQLVRYETTSEGKITAFFQDGTSATGDVLIGADGGNSKVRQQFLPHAKRVPVGINSIAGRVPYNESTKPLLPPKLCPGVAQVFGPGDSTFMFLGTHNVAPVEEDLQVKKLNALETQSFIIFALGAKAEKFDVVEGDPKLHSPAALREILRDKVKTWHPIFQQLVELIEEDSLQWLTIQSAEPIEPWPTNKNLTLLGDAIHSMTPYMGIGANTALEDAKDLTETFVLVKQGKKDVLTALRDYESKMFKRGFSRVKWSRNVCRLSHAEHWFIIWIRQFILMLLFFFLVLRARLSRSR